jgi:hypothetical protein
VTETTEREDRETERALRALFDRTAEAPEPAALAWLASAAAGVPRRTRRIELRPVWLGIGMAAAIALLLLMRDREAPLALERWPVRLDQVEPPAEDADAGESRDALALLVEPPDDPGALGLGGDQDLDPAAALDLLAGPDPDAERLTQAWIAAWEAVLDG